MRIPLAFSGGGSALAGLRQRHAQRRPVLLLGPAGAGQPALVAHFRESLRLCARLHPGRLAEMGGSRERAWMDGEAAPHA